MQTIIDLNADIGEGCHNDQELLTLVSSVNICCGAHAGSSDSINAAIAGAVHNNVAIGAHPSWPDRENFGRQTMIMSPDQLAATMEAQLSLLQDRVHAAGARMGHVKPHGALYNQTAIDSGLARTLVAIIKGFDPGLAVVGLAGGVLLDEAERAGMATRAEAFADRAYAADGTLVPRSNPAAVLHDPAVAIQQCLDLVVRGIIKSLDGRTLHLHADTLCLHGDTPEAVTFARALHRAFNENKITISNG